MYSRDTIFNYKPSRNAKIIITLSLILILVIFFAFLSTKIYTQSLSWSSWHIGDSQSIFCAEHWAKDGFLKHKLLPLPTPYSLMTKYLDEPLFRKHAHGTRVGLPDDYGYKYYTHYPFGAMGLLVAVMMKMGVYEKHFFFIAHLLISLFGVFLFFLIISYIFNEFVGLIATLFMLLSPHFYSAAFSLSNFAFDNFFPWLILYLYLRSIDKKMHIDNAAKNFYNIFLCLLFFFYAFFSIDYILLILFLIIAIHIYKGIKFNFKKLFLFFALYFFGLLLHLVQNSVYLGWRLAIEDFINASRGRGLLLFNLSAVFKKFFSYFVSLENSFGILTPTYLNGLILILFGVAICQFWSIRNKLRLLLIIILLHFGGSSLMLLYRGHVSSTFSKLFLPEVLVIYFLVIYFLDKLVRNFYSIFFRKISSFSKIIAILSFSYILVPGAILWNETSAYYYENLVRVAKTHRRAVEGNKLYKLGRFIKKVGDREKRVNFIRLDDSIALAICWQPHIQQAIPSIEYYFDSPILISKTNIEMIRDIEYLFKKETRIQPVLIFRSKKDIKEILNLINERIRKHYEKSDLSIEILKYDEIHLTLINVRLEKMDIK